MRTRIKALVGAAALCSLFASTGQAAAAPCPNEAIREEQHATSLPECRAYEQVSPVDKGGYQAGVNNVADPTYGVARADGTAMSYRSNGPLPGAPSASGGLPQEYVATRSAGGWDSLPELPTPLVLHPTIDTGRIALGLSADFSKTLVQSTSPFLPEDENGVMDAYMTSVGNLGATWLSRPPTGAPAYFGNYRSEAIGATPDFSRVYVSVESSTTGATLPNSDRYYEWTAGDGLRPIDLLPGGGTNPDGARPIRPSWAGTSIEGRNQVSADGSRVFFASPPSGVEQLYVRLVEDEKTQLVSRSELTGEPALTHAVFAYASPNGNRVFFFDGEQLTTDAPVAGALYEYDVSADKVRYVLPLGSTVLGSSYDGSRFYYTEETAGFGSPVELRASEPGKIEDIANLGVVVASVISRVRTTADGSVLTFASSDSGIGGGKFNNGGGFQQIYRFEKGGELECLSCPRAGVAPSSNAELSSDDSIQGRWQVARGTFGDGTHVFFQTAQQLVPRDSNQQMDVYEWRQGKPLELITSGQGEHGSYMLDSSADGSDVFFVTAERLAGSDTDTDYDIYDARVGGGFTAAAAGVACGDLTACRGEGSGPPAATPLGSRTVQQAAWRQARRRGAGKQCRRARTKAKKLHRRARRLRHRARRAGSRRGARRLRRKARQLQLRARVVRGACHRDRAGRHKRRTRVNATHRHG